MPFLTRRLFALALAAVPSIEAEAQRLDYPPARRDTAVERSDPYLWLEDTAAADTKAFKRSQKELTRAVLHQVPERLLVRRRLEELSNFSAISTAARAGGRLFFLYRAQGQSAAALAMRVSPRAPASVVIDPQGEPISYSVAPNGRYVAYARGATIHVRDVATRTDLPDSVPGYGSPGVTWTPDARGFFYYRSIGSGNARRGATLLYHKLRDSAAQDSLIHTFTEPFNAWLVTQITDSGRHLVVQVNGTAGGPTQLFHVDLMTSGRVRRLDSGVATRAVIAGTLGDTLFVVIASEAGARRLARVNLTHPGAPRWTTVIPELHRPIEAVVVAGGHLVVSYLGGGLERYTTRGTPRGSILVPGSRGAALAAQIANRRGGDPELFFNVASSLTPRTAAVYDFRTGRSAIVSPPSVAIDVSSYETKLLWYQSKDGTQVPLTITAKRGLARNGSHPVLLGGYGGYGNVAGWGFGPEILLWLESGGVLAWAGIRGGGELGERWHRDGMLANKQNSFDDFIAAAEYLIRERWTTPARLAIHGSSNGALLVGAVLTQRPDLFAAAVAYSGHYDMMRYHVLGGRSFSGEYGTADDPAAAVWLRAYSPLHNIRSGTCFPATLLVAREEDDRVVPIHAYKFAAALQDVQRNLPQCAHPILLRLGPGNHAAAAASAALDETTDVWTFLMWRLGVRRSFGATNFREMRGAAAASRPQ